MDAKLITVLRCPECGAKSSLQQSGKTRISLRCGKCSKRVSVQNGVARFAKTEGDPGFNQRWVKHPRPQNTPERNAAVFADKTGWQPWDMEGKTFLAAGCGAGRFPALVTANGGRVIGVDMTEGALAAAAENVSGDVVFMQADLLDLPLDDESVDAAWSLGVLHHTSDPAAAFAEVARCVKPGGQLAVWVYCRHTTDEKLLAPLEMFHAITRLCPPDALYEVIKEHAPRVRDAYNNAWGPLQQILRVSVEKGDEDCISDTFDWHTPQYRSWHTEDEVRGWFETAGFDVDRVGAFPVSVRGVKRIK